MAARLEEVGEVTALAQLRYPQLNLARTGLPVAVAAALVARLDAAFAVAGTAQAFGLQFHQALGRKADHLARECRNPCLPGSAAVATDRPADAKLLAVASAGRSAAPTPLPGTRLQV